MHTGNTINPRNTNITISANPTTTRNSNTTTKNNSNMSHLDPHLLLCLFGIQQPILHQRLRLLLRLFLPKHISPISGINHQPIITDKAHADPPLLPILAHFSNRLRLQKFPNLYDAKATIAKSLARRSWGLHPAPIVQK
jgi:hypothetical protein